MRCIPYVWKVLLNSYQASKEGMEMIWAYLCTDLSQILDLEKSTLVSSAETQIVEGKELCIF